MIVSSQFVKLLEKNLTEVTERTFKELPSMIPSLYNVVSSDSAWEEYLSVGAYPDIPEFNGKISYQSIHPGYSTRIEPKEYAAGVQFERKLLDDKKYRVMDDRVGALAEASHRTREKMGVRAFAYAFSSAFDYVKSEEGVALCSTAHTTKSGTSTTSGFSNSGTSALSKSSVAATRLLMRQFRNDISERIDIGENLALIVPDNLVDTALEIVGTQKSLDTAEGNINPQFGRYKVIPYLRLDDYDTNNWFMVDLSRMKKDLLWINRIQPETAVMDSEFETYALKAKIYFRCAYGHRDWRWIYGHQVS